MLEVVARMPYFAFVSVLHAYESMGLFRAGADLRKVHFAEEWNELHHMEVGLGPLPRTVQWTQYRCIFYSCLFACRPFMMIASFVPPSVCTLAFHHSIVAALSLESPPFVLPDGWRLAKCYRTSVDSSMFS